jgi:hypothetical protein
MTGRVMLILKANGEWKSVEDIRQLYETMLDLGFDPDNMSYEDIAQTAHNLKRYEVLGKVGYVWEYFYNIMGHPYE